MHEGTDNLGDGSTTNPNERPSYIMVLQPTHLDKVFSGSESSFILTDFRLDDSGESDNYRLEKSDKTPPPNLQRNNVNGHPHETEEQPEGLDIKSPHLVKYTEAGVFPILKNPEYNQDPANAIIESINQGDQVSFRIPNEGRDMSVPQTITILVLLENGEVVSKTISTMDDAQVNLFWPTDSDKKQVKSIAIINSVGAEARKTDFESDIIHFPKLDISNIFSDPNLDSRQKINQIRERISPPKETDVYIKNSRILLIDPESREKILTFHDPDPPDIPD